MWYLPIQLDLAGKVLAELIRTVELSSKIGMIFKSKFVTF